MDVSLKNSTLSNKFGFNKVGLFLFVQKWTELFNPKTIYSYQYRVLNSHWLMKETISVIEQIKLGVIHHANLPDLIEETKNGLNRIFVLKDITARFGVELSRT